MTVVDRAVLDAADRWLTADQAGEPWQFAEELAIAISARRRTLPHGDGPHDFDRDVIEAADAWFDSYGYELDGSDDSPDAQIDARLYAAIRARREKSAIIERPPALPDGWSWHTYRGVLVIRHNGESCGWVALSEHVPFTAQLANRIVRDLAADAP